MPPRNASPPLTVGMPVYNSEQWLAWAIGSILAQTFADFRLVISDNASTDGTRAICESFARQDARISYHRNPTNIGLFKNYDLVFQLASSPFFKWSSSSDICKPSFLAECVGVLESRPDVVLACPKAALFDEDPDRAEPYEDGLDLQDERPSQRFEKLLALIRLNNLINGVIRSDALRKTALNKVHAASDVNLLAELVLQGKFVQLPETLFLRRMNRATATSLKTRAERIAYFKDEPKDVHALLSWKIEASYLSGVWRADIPLAEKLKIYRLLLNRLRYGRKRLLGELVARYR